MNTLRHTFPGPPLSAFVESFWLYEGEIPPHTKERRLPDGSLSLIINLRDDAIRLYDRLHPEQSRNYQGSVISGAHSEFLVLDASSLVSVMGVQFKAGGAYPFLPLPVAELHNEVIDLASLWGERAFRLYEQIHGARTPEKRFCILEQFLLACLARSRTCHSAVSFALRAFQKEGVRPNVATVVERIGISQARFIQVFRDSVGLTPKQFCRVQRFQETLQLLENGLPHMGWVDLALTCGYFDQAHLIHDFQSFSGLTPGAYLASRGEYRNHISLHP